MNFLLSLSFIFCLALACQASSPALESESKVADAYETTEPNADVVAESSYEDDSALASSPGGEVRERRLFFDPFIKMLREVVGYFIQKIFKVSSDKQLDEKMVEEYEGTESQKGAYRVPYRASQVVEACEKVKGQENKVVRTAKGMKYLKATCRNALAVTFSARRPTPID
ncbi:hypothetical protein QAD02_010589 [Eretmocerus hayati]|uniref:Uncharacterized protein n=1 Tax=Eretmocerus hayati TaxID=131215 RepID=A0ACC2NV95_9HYME|nr:hypothetical protein QAD02_010589 [Eretmocerus hayati]